MKKLLFLLVFLGMTSALGKEIKTIELNASNTVVFREAFSMDSITMLQNKLIALVNKNLNNSPIYLVLDSPGGSVMAGSTFIDTVKGLPNSKNIHTITIFSASMAYQTVQALGKRYILPSGILMSHRAQLGGMGGQIPGELNTRLKFFMTMTEEFDKSSATRVGLSFEDYRLLIRDEYWATGRAAVNDQHADELINIRCHESLMTTTITTVNTMFGSFEVEFSNCPLLRAPVSVDAPNKFIIDTINYKYLNKSNDIRTTL